MTAKLRNIFELLAFWCEVCFLCRAKIPEITNRNERLIVFGLWQRLASML
jgi:hypothetical protein